MATIKSGTVFITPRQNRFLDLNDNVRIFIQCMVFFATVTGKSELTHSLTHSHLYELRLVLDPRSVPQPADVVVDLLCSLRGCVQRAAVALEGWDQALVVVIVILVILLPPTSLCLRGSRA